jgi:uncharacterized protein involved in outer membrane biogenesis
MVKILLLTLGIAIAVAIALAAFAVWVINDTYKSEDNDFNY